MRLLLVEDDPDLSASLAASLREEGYAVDVALDGAEGLQKATDNTYDAVVLDVMLPSLNGWQVLVRLRRKQAVPVLMLTALDGAPDIVKGLNHGADDHLAKPFDLDVLLARLRAVIRRAKGQANSRIAIADLTIDTAARTVAVAGEAVELTAREYSLIEYLVLRRGTVVTRTELYDHLFDENEASLSNLLDVHVSNLRRKLGRDLIVTRRGHGYLIP